MFICVQREHAYHTKFGASTPWKSSYLTIWSIMFLKRSRFGPFITKRCHVIVKAQKYRRSIIVYAVCPILKKKNSTYTWVPPEEDRIWSFSFYNGPAFHRTRSKHNCESIHTFFYWAMAHQLKKKEKRKGRRRRSTHRVSKSHEDRHQVGW